MRRARVKLAAEAGEACYHCITRTVNGERLFEPVAQEVLRQQIWQVADFCGIEILTYAILSNHFHLLIRVPQKQALSDDELLRRYRVLYPTPTRYQSARLEVVMAQLQRNEPEGEIWRCRMLALMGDVSPFMKLLKQRFTLWFNQSHQRFGTLWAERFKSVLIEPDDQVLTTVAAYIDLNPVRAGLVADPKDYRFCGYGEAVSGRTRARNGLRAIIRGRSWSDSHAAYRQTLFGSGAAPRTNAPAFSRAALEEVLAQGGQLPLATVLRCRWRYFSDGAILGSEAFVTRQRSRWATAFSTDPPPPLPGLADWSGLCTAHRLRGSAWG
jgi:putative transposase